MYCKYYDNKTEQKEIIRKDDGSDNENFRDYRESSSRSNRSNINYNKDNIKIKSRRGTARI